MGNYRRYCSNFRTHQWGQISALAKSQAYPIHGDKYRDRQNSACTLYPSFDFYFV